MGWFTKTAAERFPAYDKEDISATQFSEEIERKLPEEDEDPACRTYNYSFTQVIRGSTTEITFNCTTWRPNSNPG